MRPGSIDDEDGGGPGGALSSRAHIQRAIDELKGNMSAKRAERLKGMRVVGEMIDTLLPSLFSLSLYQPIW